MCLELLREDNWIKFLWLVVFMAERKGFEPSVSYPTQTFQVCTFDHSDTSHQ